MKRCAKVVLTLLVPAMTAFGCGQAQPPPEEVQSATPHCDVPKEPGPDGKVPPPCPPPQAHGTSQARSSYYHRPYYGRSSSWGWFRSTAPSSHPSTTHTSGTHTTSTHTSTSHTSGTTHHSGSVSRGGFGSTGSHFSGLS